MKYTIVIVTLLLSACVSVPVERKFPLAPEELLTACPDLKTIPVGTTQLSVVVDTVAANYGQYQLCQAKTNTWVDWYNKQKDIFESVK